VATKVKVGLIGTGTISKAYINGCRYFDILEVATCADLFLDRAQAVAEQFNIPKACTVEELLADPEIQIVLNLTVPLAHAEVSLAAINAGKHVYSEKPLAATLEDARRLLDAAREKGVLLGCAPDTFLGGGLQTARKAIDDGLIGEPTAAVAFWGVYAQGGDPRHDFFFQKGAGTMLDMGPYYVTALINLLGPIRRVTGSTRISTPEREVLRGEFKGRRVPMTVPTHATGTMDFASGPIGTIMISNDVYWGNNLPRIEVYGSKGLLSVPDPNFHVGPVKLLTPGEVQWRDVVWKELPLTHSDKVTRGVGVADMAYAFTYHRPHRASGELAYHALEVMTAFERASDSGQHILIESQVERPAPLPVGLPEGQLDT
jgi:predicted dehydrogenase